MRIVFPFKVLMRYFIFVPVGWPLMSADPVYRVKFPCVFPAVKVAAVQVEPLSRLISAVKSVFIVDEVTNCAWTVM